MPVESVVDLNNNSLQVRDENNNDVSSNCAYDSKASNAPSTDIDRDLVVLRKLGNAELVYEYEINHKGVILPFTFLFSAAKDNGVDLFAHKAHIDKCIHKWKQMHTFLNCRVAILDEANPRDEKGFSRERFFALMPPDRMRSLENITYLRLDRKRQANNRAFWEFLHERELNIDTVDSRNGPLWRLSIVEIEPKQEYAFIMMIHHAIVDGRNAYAILEQLLNMIDREISSPSDHDDDDSTDPVELYSSVRRSVCESIESKLFHNDQTLIEDIKLNPKYELTPESKVPPEFAPTQPEYTETTSETPEFVFLFEKASRKPLSINNNNEGEFERVTQFQSLCFEADKVGKLLAKCKLANAKLTGCLNVICSLATLDLYRSNAIAEELYQKIWYHYLVNLRPFLHIDIMTMGYWPVVQNGFFEVRDSAQIDVNSAEWYKSGEFWRFVKEESDTIHRRLGAGEHIETAKIDKILLDLFDQEFKFEQGGGVHFAVSNVGSFGSQRVERFRAREMYYNVSCAPNRWSTAIFHGLSTIDGRLCWSVGWNCQLYHRRFIDSLCESIRKVFDYAIAD
jgi:hypothetical protein